MGNGVWTEQMRAEIVFGCHASIRKLFVLREILDELQQEWDVVNRRRLNAKVGVHPGIIDEGTSVRLPDTADLKVRTTNEVEAAGRADSARARADRVRGPDPAQPAAVVRRDA